MNRLRIYRFLMGTLGIALLVFGAGMVVSFFLYQRPNSVPGIPTGPVGHYFVAFTGCGLLGWAGGLLGAARDPMGSRTVGTMTVFVLALMAVVRMAAWIIGDYTVWLGDLPRTEAMFLLLIALALVWLRPSVAETMAAAPAETLAERRAAANAPAGRSSAEAQIEPSGASAGASGTRGTSGGGS